MIKEYPAHIIDARKVICAVVSSLAAKWFTPLMWAEDDPKEVKEQTLKFNRWSMSCTKLCTGIKLTPASKIAVRKQDAFIRKYANDLLKLGHGELQTRKAITLLEVANITQCNVVAITRDKREWNWLYVVTRKLLEKFFYPFFPEVEEDGMKLFLKMCNE